MAKDGIRERHGVTSTMSAGWVGIFEATSTIRIVVSDDVGNRATHLTAAEAKYLSSELYRLALRLEEGK